MHSWVSSIPLYACMRVCVCSLVNLLIWVRAYPYLDTDNIVVVAVPETMMLLRDRMAAFRQLAAVVTDTKGVAGIP